MNPIVISGLTFFHGKSGDSDSRNRTDSFSNGVASRHRNNIRSVWFKMDKGVKSLSVCCNILDSTIENKDEYSAVAIL